MQNNTKLWFQNLYVLYLYGTIDRQIYTHRKEIKSNHLPEESMQK